jgi:hypothetical protein
VSRGLNQKEEEAILGHGKKRLLESRKEIALYLKRSEKT